MKVLEYAPFYGLFLNNARRFTDEEKQSCADWFKDYGLCGIGECIELANLQWNTPEVHEILTRRRIGAFKGCDNSCYEINDQEWDMLVNLENIAAHDKRVKDLEQAIQSLREIISECERQGILYTDEEARRMRKVYNDVNNEGGEGFVPHFYTKGEYESAKKCLDKIINELNQLKGENTQ